MAKIKIIFLCLCFTRLSFADNAVCHSGVNELVAIFDPISYTCASGYFLPANTTGCQPCPTDYTCSGGTFYFNDTKAQGIQFTTITTDITNACSTNFPNDMVAVFEPITINLSYDDGNGNVTSTTCEYGDTITLPETVPTRPGYTFTGWVVRQE